MSVNRNRLSREASVQKKAEDVRRIQLMLLERFISVCVRYHLTYYLAAGTLLGCVRCGGFIPWDDDIDIDMPRDDYEKLLRIAPEEFEPPFFLQCAGSDRGYFSGHAKLRDSNSTGMIAKDRFYNYNKGIFIDIFPWDRVPPILLFKIVKGSVLWVIQRLILNGSPEYEGAKKTVIKVLLRPICLLLYNVVGIQHLAALYDFFCKKTIFTHTEDVAPIAAWPVNWKLYWPRTWFEPTLASEFEKLPVTIPGEYDKILTRQYGEWRIPKRTDTIHQYYKLDPYHSYLEEEENERCSD